MSRQKPTDSESPITADQVADLFQEISRMLSLQEENPYRVRAYEDAARTIGSLTEDLHTLVQEDRLTEIEGIGDTLSEKITELVTTGKLSFYEDLKEEIPDGVLEMLEIQGLGPRKVSDLREKLDVTTIEELEDACREGRVQELKGFGEKTEQNILTGIEHIKQYRSRHNIHTAREAAEPFLSFLREHDRVKRADPCGSLRRHCETVGDIDLLASVPEPHRDLVREEFLNEHPFQEVLGSGSTKTSVRLEGGMQLDLRMVEDEQYPFALHYFTGNKQHNVALRKIARQRDLTLNEYGLFPAGEEEAESLSCNTEEDLFEALGLHYIPPELRENQGEVEHAKQEPIPDLVERNDLRGVLHVHTTWSDGNRSIKEMALRARDLGYEYIGITDHSESAQYAGGMSPGEAREQQEELDRLNEELTDITILKGLESDIHPDGSLDYNDDLLSGYDFVISSIHQNFGLSEEEQTERLRTAIENPHTTILGHPTGRLLLSREGYEVNLSAVIEAAAEQATAIEINANPRRLDLDWRHLRTARKKGVPIAICPDAHSLAGLENVRWGVGIARKGWLTAEDVLNARGLDELFNDW